MKDLALEPLELIKFTSFHDSNIIVHLAIFVEIIILGSIFLIFKKKLFKEKLWIFIILFTLLSTIMTTNIFPWEYTPSSLQALQFPWRLCAYVFLGGSLLAGIAINYFKDNRYFNIICIILIVLAIASGYYYIGFKDRVELDIDNPDLRRGLGNEAEYLPLKTEALITQQVFFVETGEANIYIVYNDTPDLVFDVDLKEAIVTELPRIYYPGYKLKCEGEEIKLTESDRGFLKAKLEKSGSYYLSYDKTFIMKFSLILSITTLIYIVAFVIWKKEKKAS